MRLILHTEQSTHPESTRLELVNERGIFVNLTRRKVNSARVKLGALLFDDGRIPPSLLSEVWFYPQDVPETSQRT